MMTIVMMVSDHVYVIYDFADYTYTYDDGMLGAMNRSLGDDVGVDGGALMAMMVPMKVMRLGWCEPINVSSCSTLFFVWLS